MTLSIARSIRWPVRSSRARSPGSTHAAASHAEVAAIPAGMDHFGVLVFHDQHSTDEPQLAFSRNFGTIEQATGDITQGAERRLPMDVNDISNLDQNNQSWRATTGGGCSASATGCGIRTARSRRCRRNIRCCRHGGSRRRGGNTEFADMRAAYDALDDETKAECEDLVCEHSQLFSRHPGLYRLHRRRARALAPVLQRLVRRHPVTGRKSLFLASHAGAIVGWPVPEARAFLRDLTEHATQRKFV